MLQRIGHSSCIRCDFETTDEMTFEQQDAAMMQHLEDKHPDWMNPVCDSPFKELIERRLIKDQIKVKDSSRSNLIENIEAALSLWKDFKHGGHGGPFDQWCREFILIAKRHNL